jgi:filamentous hemagglutinin family protein
VALPRFRRILAFALAEWLALAPTAFANPQGGIVRSGSAIITGQGTAVVTIQQRSQSAILTWQSFNIKHGETTNFQQPGPSAVALNRILSGQPSQIFGSIHATGHIYLINPDGILFGPGSSVNAFALAASTSANASALAAQGHGFDPSAVSAPGAKIVNEGRITSGNGGFVYLVAPEVTNGKEGVIVSPSGEIQLAAGATVYLTDRADGTGLAIEYRAPGSPGGEAVNLGKLVSDAGFVKLRAALVRQDGVVEANSVREKAGKIELYADNALELGSGSVTEAHGGAQGSSAGGSVSVVSAKNATVASGAVVDVSGGGNGGSGGTIELSAKGKVDMAGSFLLAAQKGSKGGHILIDPAQVEITGNQTIEGANSVVVTADQNITLDPGAVVSLSNPSGTPTYALYSGGDILFGMGAEITDANSAGNPITAQNHWNVQLVAGAPSSELSPNVLNPQPVSVSDPNAGGIYLSGASGTTPGQLQPLPSSQASNGLVSLSAGHITVRAAGDVWIGNGGGLVDQTGNIDVQAGRNVEFAAGQNQDSVIQNGSGTIRVVAGGSVLLGPGGNGNAAIRTQGVQDPNIPLASRTDGGSILVWAQTGDVDAGNANRWLQPGPYLASPQDPLLSQVLPYVQNPAFDIMPVVANGILGIGSEVGGNVTVVAGGSVSTGNFLGTRTGGSAGNRAGTGDYTGGHIGVFGQPVILETRTSDSRQSNILLPNAPNSELLVIAGSDIAGDYIVRHGMGVFRGGYTLAPGVDPGTLDAAMVASLAPGSAGTSLARSALANTDPTHGWVGTLAKPITFDLLFGQRLPNPSATAQNPLPPLASIDVLGVNGVAVRTIESPSLVYPVDHQQSLPALQAPGYSPDDAASLDAETGDVVLLGNDISIVPEGPSASPAPNQDALILPPNLEVTTHLFQRGLESRGGDFVLLNDVVMFPSSSGGLTLDVAGQVRTASPAANGPTQIQIQAETLGPASLQSFTLPARTALEDPQTGLEFVLSQPVTFVPRQPAMPASGQVLFRATAQAANSAVLIPRGTRVGDRFGHVYVVSQDSEIPAPQDRLSQGSVTFYASSAAGLPPTIPAGTLFSGPNGGQFQTTANVTTVPGQRQAVVNVMALPLTPGVDAGPGQLHLETPIPGVELATNVLSTTRLAQAPVQVVSPGVGASTNQLAPNVVNELLTPVAGVAGVTDPSGIGDGLDASPFGTALGSLTANAVLQGPIGSLASGHALVLKDPSVLPKGISPQNVQIIAGQSNVSQTLVPVVYRSLQVTRNGAGVITSTRVDPDPSMVAFPSGAQVWFRQTSSASGTSNTAVLQQSEADPAFDSRGRGHTNISYSSYYQSCQSGASSCPQLSGIPKLGTGPTHADDRTPASLFASGGFTRVRLDLAQPATLRTDGSITDLALVTEHSSPLDQTLVEVPFGNASFGAGTTTLVDMQEGHPVKVAVPTDASSGLRVQGPGSAELLVGVVPFAVADKDHDGLITTPDEFPANLSAVFDSLEQQNALGQLPGVLTAANAPFIPTGQGGQITLASSLSTGNLLGLETTGNIPFLPLSARGASLTVAAGGNILLQDRGFIGTLQGGDVDIWSVGGSVIGGTPSAAYTGKRGIISVYTSGGLSPRTADVSGGGSISVNSFGDTNVGGLALATLSGNSITLNSRAGSVNAGVGQLFSRPAVGFDQFAREVAVNFEGAGVYSTGSLDIVAKQNILIGAGITVVGVANLAAGGSISQGSGGTGSLSAGSAVLSAGSTISGPISAQGSITIAGGTLSSSANVSSAGGLVTGAGAAGVASNTGSSRASAENTLASNTADRATYTGGIGNGDATGVGAKRVVLIDVSSQQCDRDDCSS